MVCQKCKNAGELKSFQSFQYYYCRTCKEEIHLESAQAVLKINGEKVADLDNVTVTIDKHIGKGMEIDWDLLKRFEELTKGL